MNISNLSETELKALLFDMFSEKERIENNIAVLKAELEKRIKDKESPKKD